MKTRVTEEESIDGSFGKYTYFEGKTEEWEEHKSEFDHSKIVEKIVWPDGRIKVILFNKESKVFVPV